jgi:hypothetical protein
MDFDLDKEQHFGWMMDVLENTSLSTRVSQEQSQTIKTWVWDNWSNMTERSIRTLEKMIETMIEEPDDYIMAWEIDYLK